MNYTHLTEEQRYQIYALKKAGVRQNEIARVLNCDPSTISRELARNSGLRGYRPKQAHELACARRAINARRIDDATWQYVHAKLLEEWSPEQISAFAEISHETIYQRVYADKRAGGHVWRHLRCQKERRKRYGKTDRRGVIPNRKSIEERPAIVEARKRIGDFEADTIIGKKHKQAILSLVDRKSGFVMLKKVKQKTASAIRDATTDLLMPHRSRLHTITSDNGKEFAEHDAISKALQVDFFFAHPYSSWERGTNENTNGLVRQYFPKGRDFTTITEQEIAFVIHRLNNRPRKRHGFLTPAQVFFKSGVALQT